MKQSMEVLTSSASDDWGTPRHIIQIVKEIMGKQIILDPCAHPHPSNQFALSNISEGGLESHWEGTVYLNPPYSATPKWVSTAIDKWNSSKDIAVMVMLLKAYVGYNWFNDVLASANAICFLHDRLQFVPLAGQQVTGDGRAKFGSVLAYWGMNVNHFACVCYSLGRVMTLHYEPNFEGDLVSD